MLRAFIYPIRLLPEVPPRTVRSERAPLVIRCSIANATVYAAICACRYATRYPRSRSSSEHAACHTEYAASRHFPLVKPGRTLRSTISLRARLEGKGREEEGSMAQT